MREKIRVKLKRIKKKDKGKPRKRIAILGAGMSGLVAAYELNALGHKVEIYEASNRTGGRAWTKTFDDGQYHELGAMRFPASHDHMRYYAKDICKLKFRKFVNHHEDDDAYYFVKHKISLHKDYDVKLLPELNLSEKEKKLIKNGPINIKSMQLLNLFVGPLVNLYKRTKAVEDDVKALFAEGPMTPTIEKLEKISLGEFLENHLDTKDALDLIGAVTGLEVWWDKAITMFLREEITESGPGLEELIGGTSTLPDKLTKILKNHNVKILLQHQIVSINKQRNNIQLGIKKAAGKNNKIFLTDYDFVLCTIPFPVLRRIELTGISEPKLRAIRNLTYASSTKVLLNCKQRFWETNNNPIVGGGSQTDLINRSIYYPSDNFKEKTEQKSSNKSKGKGLFTYTEQLEKDFKSKKVSNGPGVIVGSYNWGSDARRLGTMSKEKRTKVVVDVLSNFHPEITSNGMVKDSDSMYWDEYEWAGGAFCFMKPGDFINYYKDTINPEGNLFFAGEHCSLDQGWIQGAIISSIRAVENIVEK